MKYKILLLIFGIIVSLCCLSAQERFSKEELLQLVKEGKYQIAYPYLEANLSKFSKDIDYIYSTGVCRVQLSTRITDAISLLTTASKQTSFNQRLFYLGKAYFLNYQFAEAEDAFNKFNEIASKSEKEDVQFAMYLSMLKNARERCSRGKNLTVTKVDTIAEENLLTYLNKQKINGHFEIFIWNNRQGIQFNASSKLMTFQSRYSSRKKNVNIFVSQDKEDKFKLLGNTVNTALDEMFVYYDDTNSALYFSSQGHNSAGGYDIFKSYYNKDTKEWTAPENMGFPVNTPFDEIAYITIPGTNQTLLASRREASPGKIVVYILENVDKTPEEALISSNIKEIGQLKIKSSQFWLGSVPIEKPARKQSNTTPLEFQNEQYQKLVHEALTLQLQSDSIRKLSDKKKEQFIVTKNESEKARLREQFKLLDKKAEDIQLKADGFYKRVREIETQKNNLVKANNSVTKNAGNGNASKYIADTSNSTFDIYYRIQVGIFTNPPSEKLFSGFSNIYKENLKEGTVKYYIGKYLKASDAEKGLVKVKDAGFKDAYIIGFYNNRIIPYTRAKELEKM
jgi:hypothetical protein